MFYRTPRSRGTSRSPSAGLATGALYKHEPERAVDKDRPEHRRKEEGEEPAEPEVQAQSETESRKGRS